MERIFVKKNTTTMSIVHKYYKLNLWPNLLFSAV